jgi:hypothetical protein
MTQSAPRPSSTSVGAGCPDHHSGPSSRTPATRSEVRCGQDVRAPRVSVGSQCGEVLGLPRNGSAGAQLPGLSFRLRYWPRSPSRMPVAGPGTLKPRPSRRPSAKLVGRWSTRSMRSTARRSSGTGYRLPGPGPGPIRDRAAASSPSSTGCTPSRRAPHVLRASTVAAARGTAKRTALRRCPTHHPTKPARLRSPSRSPTRMPVAGPGLPNPRPSG